MYKNLTPNAVIDDTETFSLQSQTFGNFTRKAGSSLDDELFLEIIFH